MLRLILVGHGNHGCIERRAVGALLLNLGEVQVTFRAHLYSRDRIGHRSWMGLLVGKKIAMQILPLTWISTLFSRKTLVAFGAAAASTTGKINRIVTTRVGIAPTGTITISQPIGFRGGIEENLDLGVPRGAACRRIGKGGVMTTGIVVFDRGHHGVTNTLTAGPFALIVDTDLVAIAIDDQIEIPPVRSHHAIGIGSRLSGLIGAAKLFLNSILEPDMPAGLPIEIDFLDFGMAL